VAGDGVNDEEVPDQHVAALMRVIVCGAVGVIVGAVAGRFAPWEVSTLLGWVAAAIVFCAWVWLAVRGNDAEATRAHATREDDSRAAADLTLVAASAASLLGVGFALLLASDESGYPRALTVCLAVATVVVSWLAVQAIFTLRYAHLYYLEEGGIDFHSDREPTYRDFAYVAFTLGMTYQVSDTNLGSHRIRSAALRHALLSYVFGIAVIAVTINVVAGLLGR
jgi:uncharacterized membrane protein